MVSNHWANGYINVATDQGMVIGDDVGTFRPDDTISYAEMVTIMIRALGYEKMAESKGGYPTGYLVTASNIGLTKNVPGSGDEGITRGKVARLVFNGLTIKLMEQVGYGSDVKYEVVDKTLLYDYLDVEKITDQVKAVGSSAIIIAGLFTSARARLTLCCSPPESSAGRLSALSCKPTSANM